VLTLARWMRPSTAQGSEHESKSIGVGGSGFISTPSGGLTCLLMLDVVQGTARWQYPFKISTNTYPQVLSMVSFIVLGSVVGLTIFLRATSDADLEG